MHWCSFSDELPCRALPVAGCFGQPLNWRFSVSKTNPNWKKNLQKHLELHSRHLESSAALQAQADLVTYSDAGIWPCQKCSQTMTTVGQAANHHCIQKRGGLSLAGKLPSKKQRPLPASIATPVTDESSVVSKRMMADIPDMPDLLYTAILKAFAGQYSQACGLHSLHVASLANVCRLSVAQPLDPHVGDCFAWLGEPNTIACIVAFAQRGKVHVTPFCRRPLALAAKCALHPEGGGCWRCFCQ